MEETVFRDAQGAAAARAAAQQQGDAGAPEEPRVAEVDCPPCDGRAGPDTDAARPYSATTLTSATFTSATYPAPTLTSATGAPVIRRNASAVVRNT
jgi:hypothetical protein